MDSFTYAFKVCFFLITLSLFICTAKANEVTEKERQIVFLQKTYENLGVINNETEENELDEEFNIISKDYIGIFCKDSVIVYNLEEPMPILYTLKKIDNNLTLRYYKNEYEKDSLIYYFDKDQKTVEVNDNKYYLTEPYFEYLYEQGHHEQNIFPLLSLFTPNIECFPNFEVLINNLWFPQKIKNDYQITNSYIITNCGYDSDIRYEWRVSYSYDQSGQLDNVNKVSAIGNDKTSYYKTQLIEKNDSIYLYKTFFIDDGDRYSEDCLKYINTQDLTDSVYCERQQNGHTYKYINKTLRRSVYNIKKIDLKRDEIYSIIRNDRIH